MRVRNRQMRAQNGLCYYCEQPMWLQDIKGFCARYGIGEQHALDLKCTAEHLIARTNGGLDTDENIVAACHYCNQARHRAVNVMAPDEFQKFVRMRVKEGGWHELRLLAGNCS